MLLPLILAAHLATAQPVSVAFFGCNRVENKDLDPIKNPSSANRSQLTQTLSEVKQSGAALLFAGGDLVNGYEDDDGSVLRTQLDAWTKDAALFPKQKLIPVPGNHELNKKIGDQRMPSLITYPIWKKWLTTSGFAYGTNGPIPADDPTDQLALDESKMSYTIDRGNVRMIVLNTDTRTNAKDPVTGTALGWIPANWAARQLAKAQRDPAIRAVFVIGHRNLIAPSEGKGDAPIEKRAADLLLAAMQGKSKFRAYVCAHVHAWNVTRIPGTHALQIISGDGGSKLEKDAKKEFGWVEIRVKPNGTAVYIHHHRPTPKPYDSPDAAVPSKADAPVAIQ